MFSSIKIMAVVVLCAAYAAGCQSINDCHKFGETCCTDHVRKYTAGAVSSVVRLIKTVKTLKLYFMSRLAAVLV